MTAVTNLRQEIARAEEAYEFLISFAGRGVGREQSAGASEEVREYLSQLESSFSRGYEAAAAVSAEYDLAGEAQLDSFLETFEAEIEEARTIIELLAAQDRITSAQVDNMNGMSVFQSVIMKFFFLDELTKQLDAEADDG